MIESIQDFESGKLYQIVDSNFSFSLWDVLYKNTKLIGSLSNKSIFIFLKREDYKNLGWFLKIIFNDKICYFSEEALRKRLNTTKIILCEEITNE